MANDKLRLARKYFTTILRFAFSILGQRIRARIHRWSYRVTSSPLNIVVIGGSFAGIQLATRLTETLPNGYRVILVEKKSHFNYTFNFPRYSVLQGHEQLAFIPYTGVVNAAPKGSLDLVQGEIIEISENEVELASGEKLGFEYLAIATGSGNGLPAKVASDEKARGRAELKKLQLKIEKADGVAVVGGGAVGVQMVGDIRSWYPGKRIALVHSRAQLLPNFGPRLHEHVLKELENMDVTVFLGQRPKLPVYETEGIALKTEDGEVVKFDLVVCTIFLLASIL